VNDSGKNYYSTDIITTVKSFIVPVPGFCNDDKVRNDDGWKTFWAQSKNNETYQLRGQKMVTSQACTIRLFTAVNYKSVW